MTHPTPPSTLAEDLRRRTAIELSLPSRLRYVGLLLASSTMTAVVTALLLTESALPMRTTIALATMALIGASWMVFATWVLTRKRVLLGNHRVVAGRLAVIFCSVFAVGALSLALATSSAPAFAAAAIAAVMLLIAAATWVRARRRFAELSGRLDELQRLLGNSGR